MTSGALPGPHRSAPPEATLARLRPLWSRLGITRLAVLTGLDVIGIPVAAAYRPNSRSIAVHQGKGATLAAAKVSALMEAAECWHAEGFDGPLRFGTGKEVSRHGEVADVGRLPPARSAPKQGFVGSNTDGRGDDRAPSPCGRGLGEGWRRPDTCAPRPLTPTLSRNGRGSFRATFDESLLQDRDGRILWAEARDLASGRLLLVPFELVSADFTMPAPPGFGVFQQTTNGLGSGNLPVEAILHGLYEVVERDAVARWHALSDHQQAACAIDPASVDGPASTWLLTRLAAAGASLRMWDITAETGLPAFQALAWDAEGVAGIEPEFGAGCHANADVALARALAEAAQARLTRISGARDDFAPASFAPAARAERQASAEWLSRSRPTRTFRPVHGAATPEADLDNALAALARAGCAQVACVDLSRPDIGIPVARIIVPGLRGPVEA